MALLNRNNSEEAAIHIGWNFTARCYITPVGEIQMKNTSPGCR